MHPRPVFRTRDFFDCGSFLAKDRSQNPLFCIGWSRPIPKKGEENDGSFGSMGSDAAGNPGSGSAGGDDLPLVASPEKKTCQLFGAAGRLNDPQTVLDYFEQVAAWSPESCLAFVIDCGLDEESAALCRGACAQHRRLHFCTQQEFARICKETQDGVY